MRMGCSLIALSSIYGLMAELGSVLAIVLQEVEGSNPAFGSFFDQMNDFQSVSIPIPGSLQSRSCYPVSIYLQYAI